LAWREINGQSFAGSSLMAIKRSNGQPAERAANTAFSPDAMNKPAARCRRGVSSPRTILHSGCCRDVMISGAGKMTDSMLITVVKPA